jgi:hypothetical protein
VSIAIIKTFPKLTEKEFEKVKNVLKENYSGLSFIGSNEYYFHPTSVIYFLSKFQNEEKFREKILNDTYTTEMLVDENVRAGSSALQIVAKSKHGKSIIDTLTLTEYEKILKKFFLSDICPNKNGVDDTKPEALLSFLYYNGLVSIDREHEDYVEESNLMLKVSSNVAKDAFLERIK